MHRKHTDGNLQIQEHLYALQDIYKGGGQRKKLTQCPLQKCIHYKMNTRGKGKELIQCTCMIVKHVKTQLKELYKPYLLHRHTNITRKWNSINGSTSCLKAYRIFWISVIQHYKINISRSQNKVYLKPRGKLSETHFGTSIYIIIIPRSIRFH